MNDIINALMNEMRDQEDLFIGHQIPNLSLAEFEHLLDKFKDILFPGVFKSKSNHEVNQHMINSLEELKNTLENLLQNKSNSKEDHLVSKIIHLLPSLKKELSQDIVAIYDGDPAAKSHEEVLLAYPSFEAIMIYRIAHQLSLLKLDLFARILASIAHRSTGIDIHPKAVIGKSFCIDHGTGIVIGETAVIGNNVKMYQGVTIGALSVSKNQQNEKRHPTIADNVTIYARTTILGGNTIIGKNSIIGGNVWLTKSIPEGSKIYNKDYKIEHS